VVAPAKLQELDQHNELNMGIPVSGVGSFRLSAFRQRGSYVCGICATFP
jgi:twitching motility protein PilU